MYQCRGDQGISHQQLQASIQCLGARESGRGGGGGVMGGVGVVCGNVEVVLCSRIQPCVICYGYLYSSGGAPGWSVAVKWHDRLVPLSH